MLPPVFDFLNGPVRELVTQIYDAVGYVGVALWVAIESVIIPIPSELVLPFAGFLVGAGTSIEPLTGQPWSLALVTIAGTIGSLIGALVAYAIGYFGFAYYAENQGKLILAGRTTVKESMGVVIMEVETEAEARRVMEDDDAVKAGIMAAEVLPFQTALLKGN